MIDDLRDFIAAARAIDELEEIPGADLEHEIGAITEVVAGKDEAHSPALLFDDIAPHETGFRILTNTYGSLNRSKLALHIDGDPGPVEILDDWRRGIRDYDPIDPERVAPGDAPVYENVMVGDEVDLGVFPVPTWHAQDGGPFIGTGCTVITRDPDTGWVNLGVYRNQLLDDRTISLNIAPGKDASGTLEKYHERGEACPVAVAVGLDATTWVASTYTANRGESEYGIAGWIRDEPVAVVEGETTGLPIPATAEIVIEGTVPPVEERDCRDGPFGEWAGYVIPAKPSNPVIEVDAVLYRDDPILLGQPPLKPPAPYTLGVPIRTAGGVWNQLEAAGVPGVEGVWSHVFERPMFLVVQIDKQYAGHGKQVAQAAGGVQSGAYGGRFVVVVDTDVELTDIEDVIWAMCTRTRAEEIDFVHDVYTSPADPTLREGDPKMSSRVLIDATVPYDGDYPEVNRFPDEYRREVTEEWGLDAL